LDLTVKADKPVIVIGAQRNTSEYDADGPRNLYNALLLCQHPDARAKGVLVTLNSHVNAAREVTKSHTVDVETFQSGEWGYLASIVRDRVRFHRAPLRRLHVPLRPGTPLPRVDIVSMYAGADGALLDAAAALEPGGIVVQAVASGHLNGPMFDAIVRAMDRDIPVVVSTRIPRGGTRPGYGFDGSSARLVEAGAVLSNDLSPWKSRVLLMLAVQNGIKTSAGLTALFDA
jgi:L-asparaginase